MKSIMPVAMSEIGKSLASQVGNVVSSVLNYKSTAEMEKQKTIRHSVYTAGATASVGMICYTVYKISQVVNQCGIDFQKGDTKFAFKSIR